MSHIWRMIAQRIALGLLTLFVISLLIFSATEMLPGDFAEARLGQAATPETVAAIRRDLGLDQPPVLSGWAVDPGMVHPGGGECRGAHRRGAAGIW